jgi:acyl-CoA synthetase (AMP-forming)/AMP-acid ligase II
VRVFTLRPGSEATEAEIITFCRERLAKFKLPKAVLFRDLPTIATGKVQKLPVARLPTLPLNSSARLTKSPSGCVVGAALR